MHRTFRYIVVLCAVCIACLGATASDLDLVRIGIVTDIHAHDADSPFELGGPKVMVNYAERMHAFVDAMNAWPADVVIELGDLVNGVFVMGPDDLGDPARIPAILDDAVSILSTYDGPIHHVIGNHDVYDLSKEEYLAGTGGEQTYYSFDLGGYHFVVLDAQYNKDGVDYGHVSWMVQGTIPEPELAWLRDDLASTDSPTVVSIHQPLDADYTLTAGGPTVSNHLEVRDVLAQSGRVIAVFQGHDHDNNYSLIDGIHYVTFAGMVDHLDPTPPTWAQVSLDPSTQTITIEGAGLQDDLELTY